MCDLGEEGAKNMLMVRSCSSAEQEERVKLHNLSTWDCFSTQWFCLFRERKRWKEERIKNDNKLSCQGKYWCLRAQGSVSLRSRRSPNRQLKTNRAFFYQQDAISGFNQPSTSFSCPWCIQAWGIPSLTRCCSSSAFPGVSPAKASSAIINYLMNLIFI